MKNTENKKQNLLANYVRLKTKKALNESSDPAKFNVEALHEDIMQELQAFQKQPGQDPTDRGVRADRQQNRQDATMPNSRARAADAQTGAREYVGMAQNPLDTKDQRSVSDSHKEAGRKWLEAAKRERQQGGMQQLPEGDATGAMELPMELHEDEPASAFDEDAYVLEPGANDELEEGWQNKAFMGASVASMASRLLNVTAPGVPEHKNQQAPAHQSSVGRHDYEGEHATPSKGNTYNAQADSTGQLYEDELEEGMNDARNAAGREQWKNFAQTNPGRYAQHTGKLVPGDITMQDGSVRKTTYAPDPSIPSRQNAARAQNVANGAIRSHADGWNGGAKEHPQGTSVAQLAPQVQKNQNWSTQRNNADRSREYLAASNNLTASAKQHLPESEDMELEEGIVDGIRNMFGKDSTLGRGAQAVGNAAQAGAQAVGQRVQQAASTVSNVAGQVKNDFQQGNTAGVMQTLHKELGKVQQTFKQEGEALKQEMSELNQKRAEFMNRRRESLEGVHQRFDTLYQKMAGLMKIDPSQPDYKSFIDQRMGMKNTGWQAAPTASTSNPRLT